MMVYEHQGLEYVPAKPICDIIGTDWRQAKRSMITDDNQKLYGSIRFLVTKIDNLGGDISPQTALNQAKMQEPVQKSAENETLGGDITPQAEDDNVNSNQLVDILCIRFDRVQMYLARVNTSRLRAHGNVSSADLLLALQQEWADALHKYENDGIAIKKTSIDNLSKLTNIYCKLDDQQQKAIVKMQIDHALGRTIPVQTNQPDMFPT